MISDDILNNMYLAGLAYCDVQLMFSAAGSGS